MSCRRGDGGDRTLRTVSATADEAFATNAAVVTLMTLASTFTPASLTPVASSPGSCRPPATGRGGGALRRVGAGAVDWRTTSVGATTTSRDAVWRRSRSSIMSSSRLAEIRPISTPDWLIVVRGGIVNDAMSMSSKPTIESWSGTTTLRLERRLQQADRDRVRRGEDGRRAARPVEVGEQLAAEPVARLGVGLGGEVRPSAVADAVLAHERFVDRGPIRAICHPLVDDADDRPMAELPEVLEGEERALLVVDVDAGHAAGPTRSLTPTT